MTSFSFQNDASTRSCPVHGLAAYLEERWLGAHLPAAERWCAEMGAVHIDEVLEEATEFAQALNLKPLEVKRLLGKPRSPLEAPARPVAPEVPAVRKEAAPLLVVEEPQEKVAEEDSDAASTAVSTSVATSATPVVDSDGFRLKKAPTKKASISVATSDAASTCTSEVSTVRNPPLLKAAVVKTTFVVEEKNVGVLMGEKGAVISRIEKDTGVKVSVPKAGARREILIQGPSKDCVDQAARICQERITAHFMNKFERVQAQLEKSNGKSDADSMTIDSRDAGILLGEKGANLRKLEERTKARITVSKEGAVRTVVIRGDKASVSAAKAAIAEQIRFVERTVEVPDWAVPEILGREGKALQKLEKRTGARVEIPKELQEGETRLVRIRAKTEAEAEAAEAAVLRIVHPLEHTIEGITSGEAGVLIGRKGETVSRIQKQSGARVEIERTGRLRNVYITGPTADTIDLAIDLLREALREDLPSGRKQRAASPPRSAHCTAAPPELEGADFPRMTAAQLPQVARSSGPSFRDVAEAGNELAKLIELAEEFD